MVLGLTVSRPKIYSAAVEPAACVDPCQKMLLWKMSGVADLVVIGTLAVIRELTLSEYGCRWMEGVGEKDRQTNIILSHKTLHLNT